MLAILAAAEGGAYSPVQIQKAAFVLDRNLPQLFSDGSKFHFTPYDYGPFDRSVYSEVEKLEAEGLAVVNQSAGRWRTYAASPQGVEQGKLLLAALPAAHSDYVRRVSEWVRSLDFATLVKSIYAAYPEMKANSVFQG